MKILVTGGAGFIGSNVVDAYVEAGFDVSVLDNLYSGKRENLNPNAKFHLMDVRSAEVRKLFEHERFDVVNHHAAQMSVPASVEDPAFDADVNVMGLINVLESARRSGTKKVIAISSGGAIYGEASEHPTSETYRYRPLSPYAITKAVSENYLDFYNHQYGLDFTVLRYANVYGPRQIPHGEAGVVAIFMDRLLNGKTCTVNRFPEEPRGMTRDYCYVGDVVRANIKALDHGSREAFNIGNGVATYTLDLFNTIFDAVKAEVPALSKSLKEPLWADARAGDLRRSCLKTDKAREKLNWRPEAGLREGIARTLQWRMGSMGKAGETV